MLLVFNKNVEPLNQFTHTHTHTHTHTQNNNNNNNIKQTNKQKVSVYGATAGDFVTIFDKILSQKNFPVTAKYQKKAVLD